MTEQGRWNTWNQSGGPRYPHEKVVQFMFRRFPDRNARNCVQVLDLGCGSGVHTVFLALEGFAVSGCDISTVGVSNTQKRLAENGLEAPVSVGSVEKIAWPDSQFDALICIHVLECAGPALLAPAFKEMARVLKPGGRAMALFASDADFRLLEGNPLGLYGFDDAEVAAAVAPLRSDCEIWMDRYITTYENRRIQQNDHLVTLIKNRP